MSILSKLLGLVKGEPDAPMPVSTGPYRAAPKRVPIPAPTPVAPVPFSPVESITQSKSEPAPDHGAAMSGSMMGLSGSFDRRVFMTGEHYDPSGYPALYPCGSGQLCVFDVMTGQYVAVNKGQEIVRPDLCANLLNDAERQELRHFLQSLQPYPLGNAIRYSSGVANPLDTSPQAT